MEAQVVQRINDIRQERGLNRLQVNEKLADVARAYSQQMAAENFFITPGNDGERLFYAWSVLFCLPTGMAEQPSAGTGTVMRPDKLRQYAAEAGFTNVQILPIEHEFWRFYRLSG